MSSSNSFPSGLKVLVVDDDAPTLKVVSAMLQKCAYQVTPATSGKEALSILRDKRQHHFDLVLSDVMMPDMDGFRLLELIGLELDLPVIMMSSNGETNTVLRGVTHGAVDFLIKPVRLEELRNMWQHVVRRRRDLVKEESEDHSGEKEEVMPEQTGKKRKEHAAQAAQDLQDDDANASKKARVVWSVEMHQQFVNAVNQLGVDKAVPKKILEIMQVDGLTRENVASHLQKYRLYLKRVATHGGQPGPVGLAGPSGHGGSTAAMNGTSGAQAGPSGLQSQPSGSVSARGAKNAANGHAGAAAQGNAAATQGGMPGISGAAPGLDPSVAAAAADPSPSPDPAAAAAAAGMAGIGPLGGPNPMGTPGFPNPLLGPMPNPMAAMMNSAAAMNPMLGGMNPLSLGMGLPPGMGQGPMQIPGLPMAGLPMSMPFMPGMGMPGMMPGMMPPPVPGLTLQGASSQPSALGAASTTSTPRQGSGSLGQQQQLLAQQQQQQQQLLAQQQQNSGGSSSGGSAGTHMGMPGQLGLQGYPLGVSPSGSPAPAQGAAMGLGLGAVRPPGVTLSGLQPGPSQLHQGATAMGAGGPTGGMVAAAPGVPNGSGLDDLFDHAELAAAFDGLYHGVDEAAGAGPGSALAGLQPLGPLQMPMMASMGGSCAAQAGGMAGMGSMGGGNGGDAMLMLPKSDPDELMQLEMKGGLAMGIGQDPAPEAMDDLLNFFFKG